MNKFINKIMFILICMFILLLIPTLSKAVEWNYSSLADKSNRLFCVEHGAMLKNYSAIIVGYKVVEKEPPIVTEVITYCKGDATSRKHSGGDGWFGKECPTKARHISLERAGELHGWKSYYSHTTYTTKPIEANETTEFTYRLIDTININMGKNLNDVNKARNSSGHVYDGGNNYDIARMAYIIGNSAENNTYYSGNFYAGYSMWQMAVYRKFSSFANLVGHSDWAHSSSVSYGANNIQNNSVLANADRYANNVKTWKANGGVFSSTSPTVNGTVSTKLKNINGTPYLVAGPFNWNFTGTIGSLNVKNVNGASINNVRYANSNFNIINSIPSNSNFYLLLPVNSGAQEIVISGTIINNMKLYYATIEFFKSVPKSFSYKDENNKEHTRILSVYTKTY